MGAQNEIISKYRSIHQNTGGKKNTNESSIESSNIEDFLFDLIKSTRGVTEYKDLLIKKAMIEMKKNGDINKVIKNAILSKFTCNNNVIILPVQTTISSIGIEIAISEIDQYGLFKKKPTESPSKYFYEGLDINKHVNYILYLAKDSNAGAPMVYSYNGKVLFQAYAVNEYTLNFKFGSEYSNRPYAEWVKDYVESIMPIYNQVNFTSVLTDILTGSLSLKSNGEIQIKQNSFINKLLKVIFGFCDTDDDNNQNNSSPKGFLFNNSGNGNNGNGGNGNNGNNQDFTLSDDDLSDLDEEVALKLDSKLRFYTCNNLDIDIDSQFLLKELDDIFADSSDDNGFIDYSNPGANTNINNTTTSSYDNKNVDTDKLLDVLNQTVKNGVKKVIDEGEIDLNLSLPNMQYELNMGLFKSIPYSAIQSIMTPRVIIVNKLYSIVSGDVNTKGINTNLSDMTDIIKVIGISIAQSILKAAFEIIKEDVLRITEKILFDILGEQIRDYLNILLSLFAIFNRLRGLFGGQDCESILSKLLQLLSLAGSAPASFIPPFLIPIAAIRPGLSRIKLLNDIKGNLNNRGIDTGNTLPDGSPNNLIIALEETVNAMVGAIKNDTNVQVYTTSALGPTIGNAIIQ